MKKLLTGILLSFFLCSCSSNTVSVVDDSLSNMLGEWTTSSGGEYLYFGEDQVAEVRTGGTMGTRTRLYADYVLDEEDETITLYNGLAESWGTFGTQTLKRVDDEEEAENDTHSYYFDGEKLIFKGSSYDVKEETSESALKSKLTRAKNSIEAEFGEPDEIYTEEQLRKMLDEMKQGVEDAREQQELLNEIYSQANS